MTKNITYEYNEGSAKCIINYNGFDFIGLAKCHPEDEDMKSEYTGCAIASMRAEIEMLTHIRDNEIKPAL